jgi:hypothetical protein
MNDGAVCTRHEGLEFAFVDWARSACDRASFFFAMYGRDFSLRKSLRLFAPNSAGDRKALTDLTLQSASQTFPFLAQFTAAYCERQAREFTAEDFCAHLKGRANAKTLQALFNKHGSDKSTLHNYQDVYGAILSPPSKIKNILEIGLGTNNTDVTSNMGKYGRPGASLRAFRDFLPNANIYGADVDKRILFQEERIRTFFVDQTSLESFSELAQLDVMFDLIIDDGLHSPNANIAVLLFGLKKLLPGGWLVVEDIVDEARPAWQVISSLLPTGYQPYLIEAKNALVFVVERKVWDLN